MLYPVIDFEYPNGPYLLPPGNLGVFPITVEAGQTITLEMGQLIADQENLPQDQSIRVWLSPKKGGMSVVDNPITAARWHLSLVQMDIVAIYDLLSVPTPQGIAVPVVPGSYWLNVLNLVNEPNMFSLEITTGG